MKNREKHTIKMTYWKDNILEVADIIADSLDDAKEFMKNLSGEDIMVKIYNSKKQLISSETINKCRGNHKNHPWHNYDDYCEQGKDKDKKDKDKDKKDKGKK